MLCAGNAPCHVFAKYAPPGSSSSPQGKVDVAPARAAYSHSASVGSRAPLHAANACASCQLTWTTGWSSRSATSLPGPSGARQLAPGTSRHHGALTTPRVAGKSSGSAPANTNDRPAASASVT